MFPRRRKPGSERGTLPEAQGLLFEPWVIENGGAMSPVPTPFGNDGPERRQTWKSFPHTGGLTSGEAAP